MEDVEPRGNASFPQLYLDSGIFLPEVAFTGIIGHNRITCNHSSLNACSVSLLAQRFVSVHSIFHLGVFCNGSQCVYLVSQLMERELPYENKRGGPSIKTAGKSALQTAGKPALLTK